MASFEEIVNQFKDDTRSPWAFRYMHADPAREAAIGKFLSESGFTDFHLVARGSNGLVLEDANNKDFVIRLGCNRDERPLVPQVLQSFYVKRFPKTQEERDLSDLHLEFLPKLEYPTQGFTILRGDFYNEVRVSGYTPVSGHTPSDYGLFKYQIETGQRATLMALDPGAVEIPTGAPLQVCSADYPSLEEQWKLQAAIVARDERLQKLLPDGPARYSSMPVVTSIASVAPAQPGLQ